jgi:hypothetical protein
VMQIQFLSAATDNAKELILLRYDLINLLTLYDGNDASGYDTKATIDFL